MFKPLSQLVDTFDSSQVFPSGFPPSVSASASQQPVRYLIEIENKRRTLKEENWQNQ